MADVFKVFASKSWLAPSSEHALEAVRPLDATRPVEGIAPDCGFAARGERVLDLLLADCTEADACSLFPDTALLRAVGREAGGKQDRPRD